jgi:hypothetical protein
MDAGYMHEFDPNRAAFCKQIVNGRHCGLSDTADVHTRYEAARPEPPFDEFSVDIYEDDCFTHLSVQFNVPVPNEEIRQFVEDAIREKLDRL